MKDYMVDFEKTYESSGSKGGGGDFVRYEIRDIQASHNVVRLLGAPRFFRRAWIIDDSEKKFPISYNKESIFQRIINKVLTFSWIPAAPESQKEYEKQYTNEKQHPDIFWMVKQNSLRDPREAGWVGSLQYPFNCIDRHDTWCFENNHTKLLAKSSYDLGVTWTAFNSLKNDVVSDHGPYQGYDIDFKKIIDAKDGRTTYVAHRADGRIQEIAPLVKEGALTQQELNLEKYDLDEVSRDTTAQLILKHLREKIGRIDKALKTTYIRDLETLAEKEEKEKQANSNIQSGMPQSTTNVQQTAQTVHESQPIVNNQPVQQPPVQSQPVHQSVQQAPVQQPPVQSQPVQSQPVQQPVQQAPVQQPPVQSQPVQSQPVQQPVQQAPVQQPVQQAPVQQPSPVQASMNEQMLPCVKCNQLYSTELTKCPHCGYEEPVL